MKHWAIGMAAAAFMSGCATTDTSSQIGETVYTGFSEMADGSQVQKMRGLVCPAELDGLTLMRAELLQPDGSDAFCNYNDGDDRIYTVYLSDFPNLTFNDYVSASVQETGFVLEQSGFQVDEELSETCESTSLDIAAILQGFSEMEGNEIQLGADPAIIFVKPNRLSILSVTEVLDRRYLKFRYTLPGAGEGDVKIACAFLRERSLAHQKDLKAAAGVEMTEGDRLLSLIKDSNDADE